MSEPKPLPDVLRCVICGQPAAYKAVGGAACSEEHIKLAYRRATARHRPLCCLWREAKARK